MNYANDDILVISIMIRIIPIHFLLLRILNLCIMKLGSKLVSYLKKALSEGFHIMLRLKKDSDYIIHKYKCNNNKNQPCVFRINLQANNYNTNKQYYEITKFSFLKHNHTLNSFLFAQHLVDKKTKTILSDKSAKNQHTLSKNHLESQLNK